MMDRKTEKLLSDFRDADQLSADEVRARLAVREQYPSEYLAAQERRASQERDESDRVAAREQWLRLGGDERSFSREWESISTAAKRQAILQEEQAARAASWQSTRENF